MVRNICTKFDRDVKNAILNKAVCNKISLLSVKSKMVKTAVTSYSKSVISLLVGFNA